jgi:Tol biopolymer transport system component
MWKIAFEGGMPELLSFGGDNPVPGTLRPFAVSRQGRRLAYVKSVEDTNIWRFEIPGGSRRPGRPVKLIASTQHETAPQFSPDGKKIAFESHRSGALEIWVSNADGSNPLQLTFFRGPMVGTPRWSPDGTRIAFDARLKGHADICTIPASGGAIRRVTEDPSNEVVPSWSNDGRWIYFTSNRGKDLQVWKIPAGGGKARQVTRNGGFAAFESSDGEFLYYAKMTDSGIWRMPVNGGDEKLIADVVAPGRWGYWALAPKGIYFVNLDSPRNHMIDFFNFSTKKMHTIASLTEQFNTEAADSALAVSPDGRWILYTQLDQAESDIMLVEDFR